ncbi:unnamed protein product [Miscanthus lutarioriparius]|uniref:non-specific serine/threonine protein kinase n=1 Tax=Miscanthus lutarioriparius TaxID=422564 RepID=A0A811R408_9POAL|nr:unnamed protein product [Miscanthus lutarioriparius]
MAPSNLLLLLLATATPLITGQLFDYPTANLSTMWTNNNASLKHSITYADGSVVHGPLFSVTKDHPLWSFFRRRVLLPLHTLRHWCFPVCRLHRRLHQQWCRHHLCNQWHSAGRSIAGMMITELGNLVLFDQKNATVWQSFEHPTDALVPGQSLLESMRLTANTSATNWTQNQLYITVLHDGLYAYVDSTPPQPYFSKLVNKNKTGNHPTQFTLTNGSFSFFVQSTPDPYSSITLPAAKSTQYMRFENDGHLRLYEWSGTEAKWVMVYDVIKMFPDDDCAFPTVCGEYGKAILGAIIGGVTGIVLVLIVVTLYVQRRRKYHEIDEEFDFDQLPGKPMRFSYAKLRECTEDFSQKLGEGGFGSVFEGKLNEERVAVKRLESARQGKKEFLAEIETIGSTEHINLVRLVGFCVEKAHRLLVYEYMPRGSLDRWIYYRHNNAPLDWSTRCRIILDIAKGLCYLHEECRRKIAHLDIKPQNILLDDNFNAKLADFGLSKLIDRDQSKVVTVMRGTPGYLAPEWLTSQITEKVDIYSFGVVVMEVICGRKNIDNSQPEESIHLINLLQEKAQNNRLIDMIDKQSHDMVTHQDKVIQMMKLAMWCLQHDSSRRPLMSTVIKKHTTKKTLTHAICYPVSKKYSIKKLSAQTREMLQKDLEARVNWGSDQQPIIHEFDMSSGGERKLVDDVELAFAFSERMDDKKLFLFVDIVDKPADLISNSTIIEAAVNNVGHDNVARQGDCNNEALVSPLIDWDNLEIIPLAEDQIGAALL